jgi:phospholipid-binding lipoprotein MlaA
MPRSPARLLSSLLLLVLLTGCATLPPGQKPDPRDRFERFNRSVYRFNDGLDRAVARPVAVAYTKVTPAPVRSGVSNFLANLNYPVTVVNDALQAKPKRFGHDAARLLINTTIGIGGLFDPATKFGLQANDEDFGQTLGFWGVPPGPYLVLPVLGPSDVRDAFGKVADHYTEPQAYFKSQTLGWGLTGMGLVDKRAGLLDSDGVLKRTFDPYAFVRNAYLQRRQFLIYDGNPPDEPAPDSDSDDSTGTDKSL